MTINVPFILGYFYVKFPQKPLYIRVALTKLHNTHKAYWQKSTETPKRAYSYKHYVTIGTADTDANAERERKFIKETQVNMSKSVGKAVN